MRAAVLACLALLAGCGALPQPFFGNPGAAGLRLAAPPPSRLAIPTPPQSLLDDRGAAAWADATAAALADLALPASHAVPQPGDWTLELVATAQNGAVVPTYTVRDSQGKPMGTAQGAPVAERAWAQEDAATFAGAAAQVAPQLDRLLTGIEAARLHEDPNSLQNRPARVWFAGVTGAPGDGNVALAEQIRRRLPAQGVVVQEGERGADYKLRGEVRATPAPQGQLKVELQWIVDDARGERGRVVQLNEVPAAAVERFWGDVAVVAAEQAAGGIKDVLFNAAGPRVGADASPNG